MASPAAARLIRGSQDVVTRRLNGFNSSCLSRTLSAAQKCVFSTERIQDIQMNPNGLGRKMDEERKIMAERALGNFWMMQDLNKTDNKPIITNETLIPEAQAQLFPSLGDWTTLEEGAQAVQEVPNFFLRNNRAEDAKAQCTLVAICFKQFGAQMLPTWTVPFQDAFRRNNRVEVVHLNITEGWFLSKLSRYLTNSARKYTPKEQWLTTLLHYASDTDHPELATFKDILRMHNTLTAYVYLLDGLGRVRCAASGRASQEEVNRLISYAKDLTPMLQDDATIPKRKNYRRR